MKILFVLMNGTGTGGTIRTTTNLANHLAKSHSVEILAVTASNPKPFFPLHPDVRLRVLQSPDDARPGRLAAWLPAQRRRRRLLAEPSALINPTDRYYASTFNGWTDRLLVQALETTDADVVIGTRASLSLVVARHAPRRALRIGWEHLAYHAYAPEMLADMRQGFPLLDALVPLTAADGADHARNLGDRSPAIVPIVNALPDVPRPVSDLSGKVVVAAGRLVSMKRFDWLISAFEKVVAVHPDWQLRIHGAGELEESLRRRIRARHLYNSIFLMGRTNRLHDELVKGSIAVLSSRLEGLPMIVMEATGQGIPVVAFDCAPGLRDMITPGVDGVLAPVGDVDALAAGILELIEDEDKRRRYGAAALARSKVYDVETVGRRWQDLFDMLRPAAAS
jgi:glycosyltransferase involved in cell wall biosynthesis